MNTETIRKICLALPCATEAIKWEHNLVFSVADKMFCITSFEEPLTFSFKVGDDVFEETCCREGFIPAPYLARAKWVLVSGDARLSLKDSEQFIKNSYNLVISKLSKKQRSLLEI